MTDKIKWKAYRSMPPFEKADRNDSPPNIAWARSESLFVMNAGGFGRTPDIGEAFWWEPDADHVLLLEVKEADGLPGLWWGRLHVRSRANVNGLEKLVL